MKPWHWIILGLFVLAAMGGGIVATDGTWPDVVKRFAEAIASAEGFFIAGSIPNRRNNPGDLEVNGVIATFNTAEEGWAALYHQVSLMFFGGSAHYNASMTIEQIGYIYADGQDDPVGARNWSNNVAGYLGVPVSTTLETLKTA